MKEGQFICFYEQKQFKIDEILIKKENSLFLRKTRRWISETEILNLEEAEVMFRKENAGKIMDFTNPNKKIDTTIAMLLLEFNKAKEANLRLKC